MSTVTAQMVKELRERTGAGMMECKKFLVASDGNIDLAIENMRKSGQATADKKASRVAAEGVVLVCSENGKATMVEINSETDFVARDENFINFSSKVIEAIHNSPVSSLEEALEIEISTGETIEKARQSLVSKIGENIKIRRFNKVLTEVTGSYSHSGKIGVLVGLKGGDESLAKDIAMHIAAASPMVVSQSDVPAEAIAKEREIFMAQTKDSGKPADIIEKITEGKIRKFLDEQSLYGQAFVKNPSQKVSELLKSNNATVVEFKRFNLGEGIEKNEVDFATEVMSQLNRN